MRGWTCGGGLSGRAGSTASGPLCLRNWQARQRAVSWCSRVCIAVCKWFGFQWVPRLGPTLLLTSDDPRSAAPACTLRDRCHQALARHTWQSCVSWQHALPINNLAVACGGGATKVPVSSPAAHCRRWQGMAMAAGGPYPCQCSCTPAAGLIIDLTCQQRNGVRLGGQGHRVAARGGAATNPYPFPSPALPPLSVNAGQQPSSSAAAPLTACLIAALTAGKAMKCSLAVNGTRVATCCLLCCGQLPCPDAGAQLLHVQWALGPASRCQQVQAVQSHYIRGSEPAERRHQGDCQHFSGRLTCR